jgi:NAD(P)-dependent dehydrogenase (short-subunit alcohol dehydrogenase family)
MEFHGKIALVTGAGQGIGRATALALAREGADVVCNDLNLDLAENTAKEIRAIGPKAMAIQANVAIEKEVEAMVARVVAEWGGIDILVNNAGTGRPMMVEDMDKSEWDRILDINLGGVFNCSRAVIPTIKARGGGKIINIASLAGKTMSYHGGADYTASKAAVLGFTRHLAFELGPHGVNVNAICPGVTMTPLVEGHSSPEMRESVKSRTPMRDLVKPEDIADAVIFLASKKARMITGSTIDVDGGISLGLQDWDTYVRTRKEALKKKP